MGQHTRKGNVCKASTMRSVEPPGESYGEACAIWFGVNEREGRQREGPLRARAGSEQASAMQAQPSGLVSQALCPNMQREARHLWRQVLSWAPGRKCLPVVVATTP